MAIIGNGYVGKSMNNFFKNHYETHIYDPYMGFNLTKDKVNN